MKKTKKRRFRVIANVRYQLKAVIFSAAILIFFSSAVFLLLNHFTEKTNSLIRQSTVQLTETVTTEDNIVKSFVKYASALTNNRYELRTDKIEKDHAESIQKLNTAIDQISSAEKKNRLMLNLIFIILAIQLVIFIIFIIRFSFKTSGPIRIMSKMITDFNKGKKITFRELRRNDEFRSFYKEFSALLHKIQSEK